MSDCTLMRESMPLLLTESLDPVRRETAHQHIEQCAGCSEEWAGIRETWNLLETLPEVEVPQRVKQQFLNTVNPQPAATAGNVVPFERRTAVRWLAQAAAVVVIAGGAYFAGHRNAEPTTRITEQLPQTPATVSSAIPVGAVQPAAFSIAESRVLPASQINPNIEGRPDVTNFSASDSGDGQVAISFDITSHVTVTGRPKDPSILHLASYIAANEDPMSPSRTRALDWIRNVYTRPENATPEITSALASVLRNDSHEGKRLKAVETLTKLPASAATKDDTREALIQALKSDPNPAVRLKAIEGLANLLKKGGQADDVTLDILQQTASRDKENPYVRLKAAEALGNAKP